MPRPWTARPRVRLTVELDPALIERLNRAAEQTGRTRYQLVAEALERYLPELERKPN